MMMFVIFLLWCDLGCDYGVWGVGIPMGLVGRTQCETSEQGGKGRQCAKEVDHVIVEFWLEKSFIVLWIISGILECVLATL